MKFFKAENSRKIWLTHIEQKKLVMQSDKKRKDCELRRFTVDRLKAVFLVPSALVKNNAFRRFEDFKSSISE